MFKDTSNGESETGFAEAYRSQILNKDDDIEDVSSRNLIIILVLVIIVVALGIFGYSYLSQNNQADSKEIVKKEESTKEEAPVEEEEVIEPPVSVMLNNINDLMEEDSNSTEQEKSADSITIEKETIKEEPKKVEEKKTSKQKGENTYLEQLAELSKEIDGEK